MYIFCSCVFPASITNHFSRSNVLLCLYNARGGESVHLHLFRKKILYFLSEFTLVKNRCIFIFLHIKEIIPTGSFFPFYIEKYFSEYYSNSESGALAEWYFALALIFEVQYELQTEWNALWRGGVLVFLCSPCYLLCETDKRKEILVLLLTPTIHSLSITSCWWFSSKGTWTRQGSGRGFFFQ